VAIAEAFKDGGDGSHCEAGVRGGFSPAGAGGESGQDGPFLRCGVALLLVCGQHVGLSMLESYALAGLRVCDV